MKYRLCVSANYAHIWPLIIPTCNGFIFIYPVRKADLAVKIYPVRKADLEVYTQYEKLTLKLNVFRYNTPCPLSIY